VEVSFDDPRLKAMFENEKKLLKEYGKDRARKIKNRLNDLRAAETLADMRNFPGRCHELTEDLAGYLSLDLDHPYRLLFRPAKDTEPLPGGGLDWTKVVDVVIVSIADTH
jgi:plasmid maintenance system killer protein